MNDLINGKSGKRTTLSALCQLITRRADEHFEFRFLQNSDFRDRQIVVYGEFIDR